MPCLICNELLYHMCEPCNKSKPSSPSWHELLTQVYLWTYHLCISYLNTLVHLCCHSITKPNKDLSQEEGVQKLLAEPFAQPSPENDIVDRLLLFWDVKIFLAFMLKKEFLASQKYHRRCKPSQRNSRRLAPSFWWEEKRENTLQPWWLRHATHCLRFGRKANRGWF
jgi:hypothetical protein